MRPSDSQTLSALAGHGDRIRRFRSGEMPASEFRPIRLAYGLYYQLDHTSHMQRVKMPAGLLNVRQMAEFADIADEYARSVLHVTTRQEFQMHWIDIDRVMEIYERLHQVGISTRGACADSVRNVTAGVHAGTMPGELFDVTPYALANHEYFMFHPLNLTQPRKFKIAFACERDPAVDENFGYDTIQARINEIAYFPKIRDGKQGFSVFAGGGLGSQPHLGQHVRDFVEAENVLIMSEAIVRLQHRSGERKNRKRARMKYLFRKLGAEKFIAEVEALYAQVEREQGDALRAELQEIVGEYQAKQPKRDAAPAPEKGGVEFRHWLRTNCYEQSQAGYFGVTAQIATGDISSDQLREISKIASDYGAGEARASNDQNIMIPWIPGDSLQEVHQRLVACDLGDANSLHVTDVTSCPGADYCSLAMSRSMGLASAIRQEMLSKNGQVEDLGVFRIKISGCPNSCGQHQVGDIGLTGLSLKGADRQFHPHYSMLVGGSGGEDTARLGSRVSGRYPATEVPKVVSALTSCYQKERQQGERFPDFVDRVGIDRVNDIARKVSSQVV